MVGLAGILLINYALPESAIINKELAPDYEFVLVPHTTQNQVVPTLVKNRTQSTFTRRNKIQISVWNDEPTSNTVFAVGVAPNSGIQGSSFGVTITSGGTGWSSGLHCVEFSDGFSLFTMTGSVASAGLMQMTGILNIPANANPSTNYGVVVYDGNNNLCMGAASEFCSNCFTVLADSDMDGIADINDNCPNTPNPIQTNVDGDNYGAACDCNDNDPNDEHLVVSGNPIVTGTYKGVISLTSAGLVNSAMSPVTFQAGEFVELSPNFQVDLGAVFEAKIGDCP